jgi:hypothetical protein
MPGGRTDKSPELKGRRRFTIISGGQTGADRAALDFAIDRKIRHGGWCPKGRMAEDGPLAKRYRLKETPSSYPAVRTRWNVRDSDATVIFSLKKRLSGGTKLTAQLARKYRRPLLKIVAPGRSAARLLRAFLRDHDVATVNIAGPRESGQPGIYKFTTRMLERCWLK